MGLEIREYPFLDVIRLPTHCGALPVLALEFGRAPISNIRPFHRVIVKGHPARLYTVLAFGMLKLADLTPTAALCCNCGIC